MTIGSLATRGHSWRFARTRKGNGTRVGLRGGKRGGALGLLTLKARVRAGPGCPSLSLAACLCDAEHSQDDVQTWGGAGRGGRSTVPCRRSAMSWLTHSGRAQSPSPGAVRGGRLASFTAGPLASRTLTALVGPRSRASPLPRRVESISHASLPADTPSLAAC